MKKFLQSRFWVPFLAASTVAAGGFATAAHWLPGFWNQHLILALKTHWGPFLSGGVILTFVSTLFQACKAILLFIFVQKEVNDNGRLAQRIATNLIVGCAGFTTREATREAIRNDVLKWQQSNDESKKTTPGPPISGPPGADPPPKVPMDQKPSLGGETIPRGEPPRSGLYFSSISSPNFMSSSTAASVVKAPVFNPAMTWSMRDLSLGMSRNTALPNRTQEPAERDLATASQPAVATGG